MRTAVEEFLRMQYPDGSISATVAPDAFSTTQSLPALASRFLTVRRTTGVMPSTCPATTTASASPSPSPSAPSTAHLAQTGARPAPNMPVLPVLLGLLLVMLGWRLKRRVD